MIKRFLLIFLIAVSPVIFLTTCDLQFTEGSNSFENRLRGTWETLDPNDRYRGGLEIDFNTITIFGYGENQIVWWEDGDDLPFRNIDKEVPLRGYSVRDDYRMAAGKIFIIDMGTEYTFEYLYESLTVSGSFDRIERLRFNFNGRNQTLRKQPPVIVE